MILCEVFKPALGRTLFFCWLDKKCSFPTACASEARVNCAEQVQFHAMCAVFQYYVLSELCILVFFVALFLSNLHAHAGKTQMPMHVLLCVLVGETVLASWSLIEEGH